MISTKGRYALRVMLDLADHNTGDYIPLKDIAKRQEISVKYLENIVSGVVEHQDELNEIVGKFSIGWDVKRISRLNRVIMQLAAYEILYVDDVPTGVAISEAVRVAKIYDGDETGSFVNGILGAFARSLSTEVTQ